jgi:uncharacterized membrane protein
MTGEGPMNGSSMYEVTRQRIAEQQRAARQAGEARTRRADARSAAARGRHARKEAAEAVATPVIPDVAAEMFDGARDAVPGPRREVKGGGRHARSGR